HLEQLRADRRRLLVDGPVRRHRHRLPGRRGQPGSRRRAKRVRDMSETLARDALCVEDLEVAYRVRGRDRRTLHALNFRIGRGESYGLVGESGCGKSTAALAAVRYLPRNGRIRAGRILVNGDDLQSLDNTALRHLRSTTVSMVYQDPGRALNPSLRIG